MESFLYLTRLFGGRRRDRGQDSSGPLTAPLLEVEAGNVGNQLPSGWPAGQA